MFEGSLHEFATVLHVEPTDRASEFERRMRMTRPEPGMRVEIRSSNLAMFVVEADIEFLAIERVESWLQGIAKAMTPPIRLNVNPQPSQEI